MIMIGRQHLAAHPVTVRGTLGHTVRQCVLDSHVVRRRSQYDGRGSLTDVWQLDKSPRRYDVLWRTAAREVTAHSGKRARLHVVHDRSRGVEHASFMMSDPATKKEVSGLGPGANAELLGPSEGFRAKPLAR